MRAPCLVVLARFQFWSTSGLSRSCTATGHLGSVWCFHTDAWVQLALSSHRPWTTRYPQSNHRRKLPELSSLCFAARGLTVSFFRQALLRRQSGVENFLARLERQVPRNWNGEAQVSSSLREKLLHLLNSIISSSSITCLPSRCTAHE